MRRPRTDYKDDGTIEVRTKIPAEIVKVLERFAKDNDVDILIAWRMMLSQIAQMLNVGQGGFLGAMFERSLRAARMDNFGTLTAGPKIDLAKLHKSNRTKSGYVGVYANGKGFRAMAKTKGVENYIGTFESSEEAAWQRYLYYREHGLPYGELELEMERWRKDNGFRGTDDELIDAIMQTAQDSGTTHFYTADLEMWYATKGKRIPTSDENAAPDEPEPQGLAGFDPEMSERLLNRAKS